MQLYLLYTLLVVSGAVVLFTQIILPLAAGEHTWPIFRGRATKDVAYYSDDVAEALLEQEAQELSRRAASIRASRTQEQD